ncbi:MAG: hypothetical protein JWM09_1490 [Francisellaceae bacterium]|nr:hypothetical protein [Francisellaceae bacterium]
MDKLTSIALFLNRLHINFQTKTFPQKLLTKINYHDLNLIISYFLTLPMLYNILKSIKINQGRRFAKEETLLKRTFNILCDHTNQYYFIIETKSKLANHSKTPHVQRELFNGSIKKGKIAWRIDSNPPEEWANLVVSTKYINETALEIAEKEAFFSNLLNSEYITALLLGSRYIKYILVSQNIILIKSLSLYSKLAENKNLSCFLTHNPNLRYAEKLKLAYNILKAIETLHLQSPPLVHQDIKTDNFLIYKENNGIQIKLTDFGLTRPALGPEWEKAVALATLGYEPPHFHFHINAFPCSYFSRQNKDYYQTHLSVGKLLSFDLNLMKTSEVSEVLRPKKYNDIWACGIVLYQLFEEHFLDIFNPVLIGKITQFVTGVSPNNQLYSLIWKMLRVNAHEQILLKEAIDIIILLLNQQKNREVAELLNMDYKPHLFNKSFNDVMQFYNLKELNKPLPLTPMLSFSNSLNSQAIKPYKYENGGLNGVNPKFYL